MLKSVQKTEGGNRHYPTGSQRKSTATPFTPAHNTLERSLGNQGMNRLVQAKLKIGQPNDRYEQEADRVADRIINNSDAGGVNISPGDTTLQRKCAACAAGNGLCPACEEEELRRKPLSGAITPLIQRQTMGSEEEKKEEEFLQQKPASAHTPEVTPRIQEEIGTLKGGRSLSPSLCNFFEPRFGRNLSGVKVHTDERAAASARAMQARAFTLGNNLVFGNGQYSPASREGKRLLAHELTHFVQQNSPPPYRGDGAHAAGAAHAISTAATPVPTPKVQRVCEATGTFFVSGGVPPGLDCERGEVDDDPETSCCNDDVRAQVPSLYRTAREYTDRAIERLDSGMHVDSAISEHFGTPARWSRATILANLRVIRRELDNEGSHVVRCRSVPCPPLLDLARENPDLFCRWGTLAFHTVGTNWITLCVDIDGSLESGWSTLLHEVVHLSGIGDLPARRDATPAQIARGEYETYEGGEGYANAYSLRNADSYANFVVDVGAPGYSGDFAPSFLPNLSLGIGSPLSAFRPALTGRLTWPVAGEENQFILGASGTYLPSSEFLEGASPLEPTDLSGYIGAEAGYRHIFGGDIAGILEGTVGGGAYITRAREVDPAIAARLSAAIRFGGPAAGFSAGVDLQRLLHFSREEGLIGDERDDWLLGLMLTGHWGGSSARPR